MTSVHSRTPTGRVAVVTGAGRGIGRRIATSLADSGHRLVICDINPVTAQEAVASLGPGHRALVGDVSDASVCRALAEDALQHFGRLDVWVNNAGILPIGPLQSQSAALLDRVVAVNLNAVLHGSQAAAAVMKERGTGHLINLASAAATKPMAGMAAYSATKAGVLALSQALRRELRGSGVHVSAILASLTATHMSHGLRLPFGLTPLPPAAVAAAVDRTLRRPTALSYAPRWLGWVLPCTHLVPTALLDRMDDMLHVDTIACRPVPEQRTAYEEEMRRSIKLSAT
ncbi:SDR family NAD(P)-dependent oxidoreductase [Streptomyces sp. BG9H]|uniref:SDR family NAD(P)-dependent oxidoreductase n=1 Tax=Streptomyces anatolicus TaxID=2675858 RepID=A0ABS6YQ67_9ACTN|nr:SDR family NAD(P)-dependent oxidoreductase [Streptomyces anatolicus]MBW5423538.1 SDR family NAD(P)-dependent oxidoreductase [Streptomyces anatolicus]